MDTGRAGGAGLVDGVADVLAAPPDGAAVDGVAVDAVAEQAASSACAVSTQSRP